MFSLKRLLTQSAAQLWFLNKNPQKANNIPSERMLIGNEFQNYLGEVIFKNCYKEMGGHVILHHELIYFSNDFVEKHGRYCVELKYSDSQKPPLWFVQNSLLQAAIYKACSEECRLLQTAQFALKQGEERHSVSLNRDLRYFLVMNSTVFEITQTDNKRLLEFIKDKIVAIQSLENARIFDARYKHREFDLLSDSFSYEIIRTPIFSS